MITLLPESTCHGSKNKQMPMRFTLFFTISCVFLALGPLAAQEAGADFFEKKIRPILVEHCYSCHSKQANKQRGGLLLDTRDGLRAGGDKGPAIVPGKPADSLLVQLVKHRDPKLRMPRDGKLPPQAIADLEHWIAIGAPDPRVGKTAAKGIDFEAARKHSADQ